MTAVTSPAVEDGRGLPLIIAHRGASAIAPENTLAAFRLAWERGADGIEGDFHLCADGHLVCIHDKDTKRTAGTKHVVAKSTLAELRRLDVGKWKAARFEGERIATLPEVLDQLPEGKHFFIEIKSGPEAIDALAGAIDAAATRRPKLQEQLTIISFNADVVKGCRARLPGITCNWLVAFDVSKRTGRWTPTEDSVFERLKASEASGLGTEAEPEVIDAGFVSRLREAGLQFHCWTVDDPKVSQRYAKLGADSITTNRPASIRRALSGR